MADKDRTSRIGQALDVCLAEVVLLALVGIVFVAVAFVTRLVLKVDIA